MLFFVISILEQLFLLFTGDTDTMTIEKLNELHFLDRFIKESQRLFPSVPIIARRLEQNIFIG